MIWNLTLHPYIYAALVLLCIALLGWFTLRSTSLQSPFMRAWIFLLRLAALIVVLVILADPVRKEEGELPEKRDKQIVLVDTSLSMGLETPQSRLEMARERVAPALNDNDLSARIHLFRFDDDLFFPDQDPVDQPFDWTKAEGSSTKLAYVLQRLLNAASDMGVANVLVFSDGRTQDKEQLGEAVRLARAKAIPISTCLTGSDKPLPNAAIVNCFAQRQAPLGTRVPVRVQVRCDGVSTGTITLTLRKKGARRSLETADLQVNDSPQEVGFEVLIDTNFQDYQLELSSVPDEMTLVDNSFGFNVEASDPKMRVLYMEGSNHLDPIWQREEYEFIELPLLETEEIEVDVYRLQNQYDVGGKLEHVHDVSRVFPPTREEIFRYDVVICSDIGRFVFTTEQLEAIRDLVAERGGGFCMIGGHTSFGSGQWDRTIWEKMIPVAMDVHMGGFLRERTTYVEIPQSVRNHPIWRMDPDPAENDIILDKHPLFRGTNIVRRAKPAATVLMTMSDRSSPTQGRFSEQSPELASQQVNDVEQDMPLICVQPYGKGRSMAFMSDAAGGWGVNYQTEWGEGGPADHKEGNKYYRQFWVNTVRWLAENSMARRGSPVIGNTEAITYKPGEAIRVRAQLILPGGEDSGAGRVTARFDGEGAHEQETELEFDPENAEHAGFVKVPEAFDWEEAKVVFTAYSARGDQIGEDELPVRILQLSKEYENPLPDEETMKQLAQLTGGETLSGAQEIRELLRRKIEEQKLETRQYNVPLWDSPWLWGLLILLFGVEWLTRKLVTL
ncbi:hypothetical protein JXA32_17005 [Candidatus Sumerlaeota bacterium]|nr:hypothetical protein [Candidatus Sumerlaeota bacterium]